MSEEKQIEELAWDLCDIPRHPSIKSCDECGNKHCHAIYYAKRAINKGYRKQIEGEWIKDNTSKFEHRYNCSVCNYRFFGIPTNYCPNCGAKIKGGITRE